MTTETIKQKVSMYLWYIVIGIISLSVCIFLPMIGSDSPFGFVLPTDTLGWILYVGSAFIVAAVNMSVFFSFQQQAKLNIKDDTHKREADKILLELNLKHPLKVRKPRSPGKYKGQTYGFKGVLTAITSFGSAFVFVQAVVVFDFMAFLTYFITILFGLVWGVVSMKTSEQYWVDEYYEYALLKQKEFETNGESL